MVKWEHAFPRENTPVIRNSSTVFKLRFRAQRQSQAARFINFSSTTVFLCSRYIRAFPFFLLPSLLPSLFTSLLFPFETPPRHHRLINNQPEEFHSLLIFSSSVSDIKNSYSPNRTIFALVLQYFRP